MGVCVGREREKVHGAYYLLLELALLLLERHPRIRELRLAKLRRDQIGRELLHLRRQVLHQLGQFINLTVGGLEFGRALFGLLLLLFLRRPPRLQGRITHPGRPG